MVGAGDESVSDKKKQLEAIKMAMLTAVVLIVMVTRKMTI